jgi:NCS2 family nucleobase:cation symporter-2
MSSARASPDFVKDDHPDRIGPNVDPKPTWASRGRSFIRAFTTKEGLIGDYDYAFLFTPNIPFMKRARRAAPFFGLDDRMPLLLALLLGFQHALSMLAGVVTPPIILAGAANFSAGTSAYLVSTSLIVCGILSAIQITRFHLFRSPYYLGTGLISVVGTSFATIPVATGALSQMYASGYCPLQQTAQSCRARLGTEPFSAQHVSAHFSRSSSLSFRRASFARSFHHSSQDLLFFSSVSTSSRRA